MIAGPSPNAAEIKVWNVDPDSERDDLAIPLNQSGTGVGQVVAILSVVVGSDSNVIVIDEPNSFLHPGASRKLIEILRRHPNNQYIISSHSPEIISAASPEMIYLLRQEGGEAYISQMDHTGIETVQEILSEIGVRLSDVFGSDAVLWVEGSTEAACFPLLLSAGNIIPGQVTSIVALRNTGDLEAPRASATAIWEIYERVSSADALLPRSLAFSLDR